MDGSRPNESSISDHEHDAIAVAPGHDNGRGPIVNIIRAVVVITSEDQR